MNKELAKTLTTVLMQFIDRERPGWSMCCSNTDCVNLETAFCAENFGYIEAFIQKKLSRLTEFEKALAEMVGDILAKDPQNPSVWIIGSGWADKLLALAREQFIKDGYVIEKKAFHDAVEKVDPEVMKEVSDSVDKENELAKRHLEGCIKGREDTLREMRDFIESHFNTQFGTSTSTLHGNTSATDGKEHNPSFTD